MTPIALSTAASRLAEGRAARWVGLDPERAARHAAAQLPWLADLPDRDRTACLDEVVAQLPAGAGPVSDVLARWAPRP